MFVLRETDQALAWQAALDLKWVDGLSENACPSLTVHYYWLLHKTEKKHASYTIFHNI
jgi:hypothetical protein